MTAKADPLTLQTAEPDIFVGGDVFTGRDLQLMRCRRREGAVSINRFIRAIVWIWQEIAVNLLNWTRMIFV